MIFASRARCRTAGLASAFVPAALATAGAAATGAGVFAGSGLAFVSATGSGFASFFSFAGAGVASADAFPSPSTSNSIQTTPTGRMSPASPTTLLTVPSTGDGISTVALSVITDRIGSSSLTESPTATIHSTTSPSTTPSPISGILNAKIPMFHSSCVFFIASAILSGLGI